MNDEFWQWIEEHRNDDPIKLRLGASRWPEPWIRDAIDQVYRRQRAAKKIPQALTHPQFLIPTDISVEQCTSEPLALYHSSLIAEGTSVVDLTAGLGIDAIALSKVASTVTAIERDSVVAEALRHNAKALGIDNLQVICADCSEWVEHCDDTYDVAFIDPARRGAQGERVYGLADCSPDVLAMLPRLSKIFSLLIVKMSPMLDITSIINDLPHITRIVALGTTTECKELLAVCNFAAHTPSPTIEATTIVGADKATTFSFTAADEEAAEANYSMPWAGENLYIPYPAVMKVGAVKLLCQRFGVSKPAANTHIYYSTDVVDEFPGQRLTIVEVLPYASSVIKRLARRYPTALVSERNMGIAADTLRRKLGIRDGGTQRIIGFSAADGTRHLLIAQ